jgi:hypothetical protein
VKAIDPKTVIAVGPRAGEIGGGSSGSPKWVRILRIRGVAPLADVPDRQRRDGLPDVSAGRFDVVGQTLTAVDGSIVGWNRGQSPPGWNRGLSPPRGLSPFGLEPGTVPAAGTVPFRIPFRIGHPPASRVAGTGISKSRVVSLPERSTRTTWSGNANPAGAPSPPTSSTAGMNRIT